MFREKGLILYIGRDTDIRDLATPRKRKKRARKKKSRGT